MVGVWGWGDGLRKVDGYWPRRGVGGGGVNLKYRPLHCPMAAKECCEPTAFIKLKRIFCIKI